MTFIHKVLGWELFHIIGVLCYGAIIKRGQLCFLFSAFLVFNYGLCGIDRGKHRCTDLRLPKKQVNVNNTASHRIGEDAGCDECSSGDVLSCTGIVTTQGLPYAGGSQELLGISCDKKDKHLSIYSPIEEKGKFLLFQM